jgi:hypothetical protein
MIRRSEDIPQKNLFRAKPNERKNGGRPKSRWADRLNSNSLALGVRDWTHCAQDRQSWRDLLQQTLTRYCTKVVMLFKIKIGINIIAGNTQSIWFFF